MDDLCLSENLSANQFDTEQLQTSVGKASDAGMNRTLNEDSLAVIELKNMLQSDSTPIGLYMIADGMGGHDAGEEASRIAVEMTTERIIKHFSENHTVLEKRSQQILEEAVFVANEEIYKIARERNSNMGTTITVALLIQTKAFILNIGDSRIYHYSDQKLNLVTQDHSLVYRLYKIGQLQYEEIARHPNSNLILCSVGDPNLKKSLMHMAEQADHPYYFEIELERGDGLLLCSDGLWQMIPDSRIQEILSQYDHPQEAVDTLINLANQLGGDDNISVIFVRLD